MRPRNQKETGFRVNIMTAESTSGGEVYHTRMFAPLVGGIDEDHVCGSANCLMGPYWAEKKGFGSEEMKVRQVSARGGDIRVVCQDGVVKLRGQARVTGKGEIYL
jgi:predicted PhzF superfamily epimerase YddE/YHI9